MTASATCPASSATSTTCLARRRGIWLSPVTVSPNADFGYDVADYCGVHPTLGTLADVETLVADAAAARDQGAARPRAQPHEHRPPVVPSTPRSSRDNPRTATGTSGPTPSRTARRRTTGSAASAARPGPSTTAPASTSCTTSCAEQADLNWWNDEVRDEFDRILRFWFDRGVAGFRIDVAPHDRQGPAAARQPARDRHRPDHGPAPRPTSPSTTRAGPRCTTCSGGGGASADAYDPPRVLVGETFVERPRRPDPVLRPRRRAQLRVQLPVPARAAGGRRRSGT